MMRLLNVSPIWTCFSSRSLMKGLLIVGLTALLAGCPMQSSKPLSYDETKGAEYYLSLAQNSSGNEHINWQLLAIRALITEGKLSQAQQQLQLLPASLNDEQRKEQVLSIGELAVKQKRTPDLSAINIEQLSEPQKIRYYNLKIAADGLRNDVGSQLRDYIALEKLGTEQQRHQTINKTWDFLTSLSDEQLSQILIYANEGILQGWVDLLYTYRNNGGAYQAKIEQPIAEGEEDEATTEPEAVETEEEHYQRLSNAISEWQIQYSSNPAAIYLPRNIYGEARRMPEDDSRLTVALLLPLSGSSKTFGDTIRAGYMDASKYYPTESSQNIRVYDTTAEPLDAIMKRIEQQGVNIIVGPLLKNHVSEIERLAPSIPVLALNKTAIYEQDQKPLTMPEAICYFGLSPEDEARDAARHIYQQRKHAPLVIAQRGELGLRVARAFAEQWALSSGNNNAHVQYFVSADQLSKSMNKGVGLKVSGELIMNDAMIHQATEEEEDNSSAALSALINQAVQSQTDYQPTDDVTHADIDAIYVFATNSELTLIKPMLDMKQEEPKTAGTSEAEHTVKTVEKPVPPIYTSSRSNNSSIGEDFRYEMERVQFSEIPLIVNQGEVMEHLPSYIKEDYSLVRLYAMGVDAWRLANRFNELKPYSMDILNGMTGQISVAEHCEITRELIWQQYRRGQVQLVR